MKPEADARQSNELVGSSSGSKTPAAAEPEEERGWLARARAGDAAAFGRLVERYQDRAYGVALRLTRSPEEAEEVAQDGFVRAWRALPRFRGEATFSTWLHRIVIRCAFDRNSVTRARRARETSLESVAELANAADPPGHEVEGAGSGAFTRRLERLLASLSEMQRAVVALYYYEDRSIDEVARTLGVPAGTVKTHLHRARALLRDGWVREEMRRTGA